MTDPDAQQVEAWLNRLFGNDPSGRESVRALLTEIAAALRTATQERDPAFRIVVVESLDMLQVDRLRKWASNITEYGADISRWGGVTFVSEECQRIADNIERVIKATPLPKPCAGCQPKYEDCLQSGCYIQQFFERCQELGATDTDIIKHALEAEAALRTVREERDMFEKACRVHVEAQQETGRLLNIACTDRDTYHTELLAVREERDALTLKYESRSPDGDGHEKGTVVDRETSAPEIPSASGTNAGTGFKGRSGKPGAVETPLLPATSDVSPVAVEALGPEAGSEPADSHTRISALEAERTALRTALLKSQCERCGYSFVNFATSYPCGTCRERAEALAASPSAPKEPV